ncbi:hypothetical protein ACK1JC_13920 [Acinetobacter sp. TY2]|uniref:hypothetical protein n=1 Tax=Acinetobacter sp. TY2 TaxID=3387403 RepID=UPI00391775E8
MSYLSFDSLVVSDREIVDMLESQRQRVSNAKMLAYLRQRGIICSNSDSRETLVEYIASLSIDWHLIEDILSLAQSTENQQKVTAQTIKISDKGALDKTLKELAEIYNHKGFVINETQNSFDIDYSNEIIEKNNTRLIQRKSKDEKINIKVSGDEVTILNTVGEGTEPVMQRLIHELEKNTKSTIETRIIDFSSIYDSEIINDFFLNLIDLDDKYIRDDVIRIKFNNFNSNKVKEIDFEDDLEILNELTIDENIDNDDQISILKPKPQNNLGDIRSALLSGSSLLTSDFFKKFADQGYFISLIRWKVREKNQPFRTYEFSASFDQSDLRKSFIFEANKYYKYDKSTGSAQKTHQKWKGNEKNQMELKLHKIALSLYDQTILKSASGG